MFAVQLWFSKNKSLLLTLLLLPSSGHNFMSCIVLLLVRMENKTPVGSGIRKRRSHCSREECAFVVDGNFPFGCPEPAWKVAFYCTIYSDFAVSVERILTLSSCQTYLSVLSFENQLVCDLNARDAVFQSWVAFGKCVSKAGFWCP